jgi:hypothetical protein
MNKTSILFGILLFQYAIGDSLFDNRISFNIPIQWKELGAVINDTIYKKVYKAKDIGDDQFTTALISAQKISDSLYLDYADTVIGRQNKLILSAISDGIYWKTYLTTIKINKTQFISMQRIGIKKGLLLEFLYGFPIVINEYKNDCILMVDTLANWVGQYKGITISKIEAEEYLKAFNDFCEQMRIDQKDLFNAKFILAPMPKTKEAKFYEFNK